MILQLIIVCVGLLACVGLHYAKQDTLTELVCAVLTVTCALAIPVGYLMGSF
ncbi:hypothetical protein FDI64_gp91 [Mycobacterium phage Zemanar]|uniref:Membrane protein n=3 Tax=Caudoviricetes TaxID=2731619 RepID=A0A7G8LFX8_9CAUD|nr:hypothetical protein FDI64_gp91 [Mycobacterium phage Zemanar]YP_010109630.1 membrane protein [Mycobacterium phage Heath]AEJ95765.1 hypothetical protein ZEMANAR_91 [Mycobacterium phage Zemanar]QNJ56150.1 membrane protein [Mycobacterium phage Heath]